MGYLGGSWILAGILIAVGIFVAFYYWAKYMQSYWKRRGVRSIPAHWFFGNIKDALLFRSPAGVVLGDLHRMGGEDDVLGFYILQKSFLLIRNPEIIKQILIKDFNVFPDRMFTIKSKKDIIGSMNLFSVKNPEWKYLRIRISPAFTSGKIKKLFHLMAETSQSMKEYLHKHVSDDSKVTTMNVKTISMKFTTDVISSLAFGIKTNSFEDPEPEFFAKCTETFRGNFLDGILFFITFFFPDISNYVNKPFLGKNENYFRAIFNHSMETRLKSNVKRGDIIDSLIEIQKEEHEFDELLKFENDVLLAQSVMFFIAGRETSVTTTTFALCELAKHPEIQERTREEILGTLKTQGLTYESVQSMKYLHQVISETLRLYPPAPIIDRVAVEDYKIPNTNIVIEKGTPVYVALAGIQSDPRYYKDPTRFDPDRFSDERKDDIPQCAYMPFGDGPRVCIAMRVGLLQVAVGLISILSNYEVSLNPLYKYRLDEKNVFFSPRDDMILDFKKIPTN